MKLISNTIYVDELGYYCFALDMFEKEKKYILKFYLPSRHQKYNMITNYRLLKRKPGDIYRFNALIRQFYRFD